MITKEVNIMLDKKLYITPFITDVIITITTVITFLIISKLAKSSRIPTYTTLIFYMIATLQSSKIIIELSPNIPILNALIHYNYNELITLHLGLMLIYIAILSSTIDYQYHIEENALTLGYNAIEVSNAMTRDLKYKITIMFLSLTITVLLAHIITIYGIPSIENMDYILFIIIIILTIIGIISYNILRK